MMPWTPLAAVDSRSVVDASTANSFEARVVAGWELGFPRDVT